MPLINKKSKEAFKKNVETEMKSGKKQPEALAIAFSVKRKPKKMAKGGETKPDLSEYIKHSDADYASQEKGDAAGKGLQSIRHEHDTLEQARNAHARSNPEAKKHYAEADSHYKKAEAAYKKAKSPKKMAEGGRVQAEPKKGPGMVPTDAFSSRLRDEEDDLQSSAKVNNGPQEQPPEHDDEIGAKRKGPDSRDLHMKMMAHGGQIKDAYEDSGGASRIDTGWGKVIMRAEGGEVTDRANELDSQEPIEETHYTSEEEALDHASSIVAGVMAHRKKMAAGGEIKSHDSIYSDDSSQADLSRNADEDANEEDQLSFNALRKENYSESEGLAQLDSPDDSNEDGREISHDKNDMIGAIRSKMKKRLK